MLHVLPKIYEVGSTYFYRITVDPRLSKNGIFRIRRRSFSAMHKLVTLSMSAEEPITVLGWLEYCNNNGKPASRWVKKVW